MESRIARPAHDLERTTKAGALAARFRLSAPWAGWLGIVLLLALGAGLGNIGRAAAQELTPTPDTSRISDDQVNAIAKTLYCPVCENVPLDVCGTQACAQWRELIRLRLAEGWSAEQIRNDFALNYGDRVLAEPPRRGLNWLVYLLPLLFFLVGVYLVYRVLRAALRPAQPVGATESGPLEASDSYLEQIEEELKRR